MTTTMLLLDPALAGCVHDAIAAAQAGEFDFGQMTLTDLDGNPIDLLICGTEVGDE